MHHAEQQAVANSDASSKPNDRFLHRAVNAAVHAEAAMHRSGPTYSVTSLSNVACMLVSLRLWKMT